MAVKGVILSGGNATRLWPATEAVSKQLLPVYDKPMIYYPLTTLIQAGIRDILVIVRPEDIQLYERLLHCGRQFDVRISYQSQASAAGLAESLVIAERCGFAGENDKICLILGDNLFYSRRIRKKLPGMLADAAVGCGLFLYPVQNACRYGVAELDSSGNVTHIHEKPDDPPSNLAVTGLYVYDWSAVRYALQLEPSARGELEITDVNNDGIKRGVHAVVRLGQGDVWLDMGTPDGLLEASHYVQTIQRRELEIIGCPELAAVQQGFLSRDGVSARCETGVSDYTCNLRRLLSDLPAERV